MTTPACFACSRTMNQDGESKLLNLAMLLDEAASFGHVVDRLAVQDVPWRIADELGGGVHWEPPLDLATPRIRWLLYTVIRAREEGLGQLHEETLNDMLAFEENH